MASIAEERCALLYPHLPVQRGNVLIPNIVIINALPHIGSAGDGTAPTIATRLSSSPATAGCAGCATEVEPEKQIGFRPRNLQAAERRRAAVPSDQGLPAHLHQVRKA